MKLIPNRHVAGIWLAQRLSELSLEKACVLGLPRGGVPVAYEIAKELNLPWDILLVKKIAAPRQPEYAVGAVSEAGEPIWNDDALAALGYKKQQLDSLARETQQKLKRQAAVWRNHRKSIDVKDRSVILVDDGLATGLTMLAAIEVARREGAARIIIAAPVASQSAKEAMEAAADDVVILESPEPFFAVGQWYEDFSEVPDERVTRLLGGHVEATVKTEAVEIHGDGVTLPGELYIPANSKGIVIFAHGSGSTHKSPRNQRVAQAFHRLGLATLLFDLLTTEEAKNRANVFHISLLSQRLALATAWARRNDLVKDLSIGYFGASTGAGAALVAASKDPAIASVVCRGGRVDMADEHLSQVHCPVLLVVGGEDHGVIEFNEKAKNSLRRSEMVVIPGAGHLFEEPGTLDRVIEYSGNWFHQTLGGERAPLKVTPSESVILDITKLAQPIQSENSLKPLLEKISQSRLVMLGEATHGTEEFYQLRAAISRRLIEDHGFSFVAVEGDWPDCFRLNQYVQKGEGRSAKEAMRNFRRWPTWMWANEQTAEFLEWLRNTKAGFFGLDVYSLYESLDCVRSYARKLNPEMTSRVLEAYACLDSFDRDEIAYARSLLQWPQGCEKEITRNLKEILRLRLEETHLNAEELFDIQQNAKIIQHAERYYRAMITGGSESWNIRDEHMMDTLDALLRFHGPNAKGIVWAHNTHIGDYHATDMVTEGYVNLGGLARERYGMNQVTLVGFGTYQGEVLAGRAWGATPEVMKLPPASKGTYENYFHSVADTLKSPQLYVDTKNQESLAVRRGHRAVGVVYQPGFEASGRNYVPTEERGARSR